jgi:hypothetical protein
MRVIEVCTVGAAAAYVAFGYSSTGSGYPQAAAFLFAIFVATVTVGLAVSIGSHSWPDDAGFVLAGPRWLHRCHGCGHRMHQMRSAWICRRCDRAWG